MLETKLFALTGKVHFLVLPQILLEQPVELVKIINTMMALNVNLPIFVLLGRNTLALRLLVCGMVLTDVVMTNHIFCIMVLVLLTTLANQLFNLNVH